MKIKKCFRLILAITRAALSTGGRAKSKFLSVLMITTAAGALAAGETWDTFLSGTGVDGSVRAMTTFGGGLIVGGQFGTAGGVPGTFGIARWDGATWSALGIGMQNSVLALTTFNGDLIAGGLFTTASGVPARHIAKWNGANWSALGAGLSDDVYALTTFDDGTGLALYAGGRFKKSGATTVNYIAKWNGSAWSSVASGMNGNVRALTTLNDALYAGGEFTKVGNAIGFNRIAKWKGLAWSKLGTGMSATVFALTTFNGGLIAGGQFANAGGTPGTSAIARWDGFASWLPLASGMNNTVMSLSTFNDGAGPLPVDDLYVGGYFTAPVGGAANSAVQIARWDGAWTPVGLGMDVGNPVDPTRAVFALSPNPSGALLYAGGFCEVFPHTAGISGYLMGYHFEP